MWGLMLHHVVALHRPNCCHTFKSISFCTAVRWQLFHDADPLRVSAGLQVCPLHTRVLHGCSVLLGKVQFIQTPHDGRTSLRRTYW